MKPENQTDAYAVHAQKQRHWPLLLYGLVEYSAVAGLYGRQKTSDVEGEEGES